jgi:hypothetical protein
VTVLDARHGGLTGLAGVAEPRLKLVAPAEKSGPTGLTGGVAPQPAQGMV